LVGFGIYREKKKDEERERESIGGLGIKEGFLEEGVKIISLMFWFLA